MVSAMRLMSSATRECSLSSKVDALVTCPRPDIHCLAAKHSACHSQHSLPLRRAASPQCTRTNMRHRATSCPTRASLTTATLMTMIATCMRSCGCVGGHERVEANVLCLCFRSASMCCILLIDTTRSLVHTMSWSLMVPGRWCGGREPLMRMTMDMLYRSIACIHPPRLRHRHPGRRLVHSHTRSSSRALQHIMEACKHMHIHTPTHLPPAHPHPTPLHTLSLHLLSPLPPPTLPLHTLRLPALLLPRLPWPLPPLLPVSRAVHRQPRAWPCSRPRLPLPPLLLHRRLWPSPHLHPPQPPQPPPLPPRCPAVPRRRRGLPITCPPLPLPLLPRLPTSLHRLPVRDQPPRRQTQS
eukprot:m.114056 g.114056  ORF g.114056 m.114056 type:complete len:354 (+) comp14406_c1_seq5:769-1830(+)